MSSNRTARGRTRQTRKQLLAAVHEVARGQSDAVVLWHASIADSAGIHLTDYKTMSLLQRRGPMSAGAIAAETGLTTASVTALIDRLERRGFARRVRDPADGRRVIVEVTPEGVGTFAPFFSSPELSFDELYANYTIDELRIIHDFMRRSTERLHAATASLNRQKRR